MSVSEIAPSSQTSVYRYFDEHGVLIYVGVTGRGITRNVEHDKTKDWWPFVVSQKITHFPSRKEALARETELIERFRPPFNTQHNREHDAMRSAYLQFRKVAERTTTANDVAFRVHKNLPLRLVGYDRASGRVEMTTSLDDFPLARTLIFTKGVRVFHDKSAGFLYSIRRRGPFTSLHIRLEREVDFTYAIAKVRRDNQQGTRYKVAGVWLDGTWHVPAAVRHD